MEIMKAINWLLKPFERFAKFMNVLKRDKWLHIVGGILIYVFCLIYFKNEDQNMLFSNAAKWVIIAGAFKEIVIDKWLKLGTAEWNDFWATITIPILITFLQISISWIF